MIRVLFEIRKDSRENKIFLKRGSDHFNESLAGDWHKKEAWFHRNLSLYVKGSKNKKWLLVLNSSLSPIKSLLFVGGVLETNPLLYKKEKYQQEYKVSYAKY
jgi:hypothetical protein